MKQCTDRFKKYISSMGRQIDFFITYTIDEQDYRLDNEKLISVTPHFKSNILKSAMKELDFETTELIPKGTIVNAQFGVLVDKALTVKEVNEMKVNRLNQIPVNLLSSKLMGFEYISYGNYIVADEPTYNADTNTYTYNCFDKMLYSMVDYENSEIIYPITIRSYINAICTKLGLTFKNANETFANYNKQIQNELYLDSDGNSLGYTFRDVLDELAQVTASIICINESSDELEIRYPTDTNDTIDENFLKDINVEFKEKYGAINVIVLSRSAGADNIYYPTTLPDNPCEIKIEDNQIMNWDDRDTYMPDIYEKLNGLEYYINDFNSTGILIYELGDFYNIQIGEDTYKCLMLNDEVDITQGLEEIIYTDMPEEGQTDYKKADTTDNRVKKTIFQVNKQEGKIEGIIEDIGDRSQKTTSITADLDRIESKVDDIEDVTDEVEGIKTITLANCVKGNLLELHIYGNNTVFDYLRIGDNQIISDNLKIYGDSEIVVTDAQNNSKTYELGITEVLRQNGNVKDEYVLDNGNAKIIRRIASDGTVLLQETTEDLGELYITLNQGTNIITIKNYSASLKSKFAIQSEYTNIFATQVELSSSITQTSNSIQLLAKEKLDAKEYTSAEILLKINNDESSASIKADKINLNGVVTANKNFKILKDGSMEARNGKFTGGKLNLEDNNSESSSALTIKSNNYEAYYMSNGAAFYGNSGFVGIDTGGGAVGGFIQVSDGVPLTSNYTSIQNGKVSALTVVQRSLESSKKNFEKFNNALDIIKNIEIYKYNYIAEKDRDKKHIGLVIGDKYKYSKEVTSKDNDGVDIYSFVSVCCKAIQEQQEEIEQLQKELKTLKGGNK